MWIFKKPDRKMFLNWQGYLVGTALVALASLIKYVAPSNVITRPNSLPYILAIVFTAIFFGLGPSIFVSVISVLVYLILFRSNNYSLTPANVSDIVVLIIFLITGVIISFLGSNLRYKTDEALREISARKKTEAELEKYRDGLEDLVKQRTVELEKANAELLASEDLLKRSQEIAHLGSWVLDLVNNRLSWSDEVYRIFGLQPQKFSATYEAFLDAVHPDDRVVVDTAYSTSVREGNDGYEIEHRVICKDTGEIRYVHEKCQNIKDADGKIVKSVGMVQDITDRKLLEQRLAKARDELELKVKERTSQLAESEEKYRHLVENAKEAISVAQGGRLVFFNHQVEELSGYSEEELKTIAYLELTHPDDRELVAQMNLKRMKGEYAPSSYEFRIKRKDGSTRWVEIHAVVITWESKPATLTLLTDITERKNMEQDLKDYAQKITQVQEEERKRIAYELHDDTAQYLSILKLQLDSVIHSGKIQDAQILEKLKYLEKDAGRAVDDVRRYSHELRPGVLEHLGLQAALDQIAEDVNKLKQITVELNVDGEEPVLSEEVKLGFFRIAQEAINNARKHAKATKVNIKLENGDNRIRMTVSDDGSGFDVQKAKMRTGLRGSLGLMSMQERAKLIGADLKIESEPGKGTTVTVEMPL